MDQLIINDSLIQTGERRDNSNPYSLEFSKRDVNIKHGESIITIDEGNRVKPELSRDNFDNTVKRLRKGAVLAKVYRVLLYLVVLSLGFFTWLIYKYIGGM